MSLVEMLEARVFFAAAAFHHRALSPGTLDPNFGSGGIVVTNGQQNATTVQPDGKILIGPAAGVISRDLPNGAPDPSFGSNGTLTLSTIGTLGTTFYESALQSDGKIVLAGVQGVGLIMARLNPDGTLDTSFGDGGDVRVSIPGVEVTSDVQELGVQSDDKIVLVIGAGHVLRRNPDGTPDLTFGAGGDKVLNDFSPYRMKIATNGDLLLAGHSNQLNSYGFPDTLELLKLNPDGSPDQPFGTAGVFLQAHSDAPVPEIAIKADGKVVMTTVPFTGRPSQVTLRRFNIDGTPDASFGRNGIRSIRITSVTHVDNCAVEMESDGSIFVAVSGHVGTPTFAHVGSTGHDVPLQLTLLKLTADGRVDHAFGQNGRVSRRIGHGGYAPPVNLASQPDGMLLVGSLNFIERFVVSAQATGSS